MNLDPHGRDEYSSRELTAVRAQCVSLDCDPGELRSCTEMRVLVITCVLKIVTLHIIGKNTEKELFVPGVEKITPVHSVASRHNGRSGRTMDMCIGHISVARMQ